MQPVTIAVQAVDGLGNRLTGQLISVFQAYFSMSLSTPCSFPQGQNLSTSISPQTGEGVFSNLVIYGTVSARRYQCLYNNKNDNDNNNNNNDKNYMIVMLIIVNNNNNRNNNGNNNTNLLFM